MTDWTTNTCKVNDINVHYLRTGGDKPPVILLHGLIANGACWTPLARALEKDYDVIMPDARGHGKSAAPDYGYHYDDLATDVEGLIDVLGLASPVLVGHSMGGMTAAVVASRNPQRLQGLILVDPTFLVPQRQREVYESDVADQHRQMLKRPRENVLAEMRARRSHRSQEIIELLVQARFQTSLHAFEILMPPNPDYMQLIHAINIPSLLVIGDMGSVISTEIAAELTGINKHLKIAQILEAGHGIPYDQPEHLADVIQTFLYSLNA